MTFFECKDYAVKYCIDRGWQVERVFGKTHRREFARQRGEIWYQLRLLGCQYKMIGAVFKRNHSSLIRGVRVYEQNRSGV